MGNVWMDFLSKLVEGVLLALAPVMAGYIASWLIAKARMAWSEYKAQHVDYAYMLESIARIAVKAAEQAQIAELIEDKKSYAVQTVQAWLDEKGFKIDLLVIEAAIEAAVYDEFTIR